MIARCLQFYDPTSGLEVCVYLQPIATALLLTAQENVQLVDILSSLIQNNVWLVAAVSIGFFCTNLSCIRPIIISLRDQSVWWGDLWDGILHFILLHLWCHLISFILDHLLVSQNSSSFTSSRCFTSSSSLTSSSSSSSTCFVAFSNHLFFFSKMLRRATS